MPASDSRQAGGRAVRLSIFDRSKWIIPARNDPRWIFACFLGSYVLLGHFMLSFNRSPEQIVVAILTCTSLDMLYTWVSIRKFLLPLSGLISAFGLSILFTAPGATWLMLLVSWICITAKYLITWRGHHIYNPTNFALVVMILISGGQAAIAPAYQWSGNGWITLLVLSLGLVMMWRVNKLPAVLSFWLVYAVGALVRSYFNRLPVEITLWATVSGGEFMLYSFFMITDPKTSPSSTNQMIIYGICIGLADMIFELDSAVFSLFYAAAFVATCRFVYMVTHDLMAKRRPSPEMA
jgi:Na+-translocating ferredoxin:NAD+ oxidoreductase RnfD subunit